jgi:hypothetical protein
LKKLIFTVEIAHLNHTANQQDKSTINESLAIRRYCHTRFSF